MGKLVTTTREINAKILTAAVLLQLYKSKGVGEQSLVRRCNIFLLHWLTQPQKPEKSWTKNL